MNTQTLNIPVINLNSKKDVDNIEGLFSKIENIDDFTIDLNTKTISVFAKKIWKVSPKIFEALKPVFNVSLQLLAYFVLQSERAMQQLDQLEAARPK